MTHMKQFVDNKWEWELFGKNWKFLAKYFDCLSLPTLVE